MQRAATQCVARALRRREERLGAEAGTPALLFSTTWLLRPDQGRETLGKVIEGMQPSAKKKQILQTKANVYPCGATLHNWGIVPSAACALCACPAETQSHVQCWCPALQEARIKAHHSLAQRLWREIEDATKKWVFVVEATVETLWGLPQPIEHIDAWQRACDDIVDDDLEAAMGGAGEESVSLREKQPDAWGINWGVRY